MRRTTTGLSVRSNVSLGFEAAHGKPYCAEGWEEDEIRFDPDVDGSHELRAMIAKNAAELMDDDGRITMERLLELERTAQPTREAAIAWLDANGWPLMEDDDEFWDEDQIELHWRDVS